MVFLTPALALALAVPQEAPAPVIGQGLVLTDAVANVAGGVRRDHTLLGMALAGLVVDGELAFGLRGLSMRAAVLATAGGEPGSFIGDIQGANNIAAPNFVIPYELWVEQNLASGHFSLLAGLYDVNSEFDVLSTAAVFINSSFGIGPDLSLSGRNGAPTYPNTGLAARLTLAPWDRVRLRLAFADGTPGSVPELGEFEPGWTDEDGSLMIAELTYMDDGSDPVRVGPVSESRRMIGRLSRDGAPGKIGAGYWRYFGYEFGGGGSGGYVLAERRFDARSNEGGPTSLGVFARLGFSTGEASPLERYLGAGLTVFGIVPGSPDSAYGLGLAAATARSPTFYERAAEVAREGTEVVVENTLRVPLKDYLFIQPSLQFILHPVGMADASNAMVFTLRAGITP